MVNQLCGDAIEDFFSRLVHCEVYPLVVHEVYMTTISPCEGLHYENNKIYLSCEILKEIDEHDHMKA